MIMEKIAEIKEKDPLTKRIIGCAFRVHGELGCGFIEKVYHNALKVALKQEGLKYKTEKIYRVSFEGQDVGSFRLDLIIEEKVILEVKALAGNIPAVFEAQVISYLKVSGCKIGLLINFGNKSCQVRRLMC